MAVAATEDKPVRIYCDGCKHLRCNSCGRRYCGRASEFGIDNWLGCLQEGVPRVEHMLASSSCISRNWYATDDTPAADPEEKPATEKITTDYPVCPYCGYRWTDWYLDIGDGSDGEMTVVCADCERECKVKWYTETTFTTTAVGEDATDAQE